MKSFLKKILPQFILNYYGRIVNLYYSNRLLNIFLDFQYDFIRYYRLSSSYNRMHLKEHYESFLIKEYHAIEKALSLQSPRPGFGEKRICRMMDVMDIYILKFKSDKLIEVCDSTLYAYKSFNDTFSLNSNKLIQRIDAYLKDRKYGDCGGFSVLEKKDFLLASQFKYTEFVKSRYSIREFDPSPIDIEFVVEAVKIARFSPSACNRQAWHTYYVTKETPNLFHNVLNCQNGNAGFTNIFGILIIAGSISSFYEYERHQVFIDGGMFSMNLLHGLHSVGLGSCCLNTSYTRIQDRKFRQLSILKENEVPIMMIAIGNLKNSCKIAKSERKDIDLTFTILNKDC